MPVARFSIIITSHNQREFISDAVDSALFLPAGGKEIIVVDDASTDGSPQILSEYGSAIRLISLGTNKGRGGARNCGVSAATGDYLAFLDGDDVFLPWALEVYERLVQAKQPKLILSLMTGFSGSLSQVPLASAPREIHIVQYEDYMRKDRPFSNSASALVIDRRSLLDVQGWEEGRAIFAMQDQDLVIKLGDSGRTVQILSPPTVLHRSHAGQATNEVPPFLRVLHEMIRKEGLGQYPGGRRRRFDRSVLFGGLVFFWTKRAYKSKLYWDAAKLFARGWPMVAAAVVRRAGVKATGRRPSETIEMSVKPR